MACIQNNLPTLTQGCDTTFGGGTFLFDYFNTTLNITNYTAKCEVPKAHFTKDLEVQYDSTREKFYVDIEFTAEETSKMPPGEIPIIIVLYDENKNQQSLKQIMIKVLKRGC